MNDNGYLPANPQPIAITAQGDVFSTDNAFTGMAGLTKREHFAALAMQGILSQCNCPTKLAAMVAVKNADALLAELELTPK